MEVPLDPGPHSGGATAPGFLPFSATVELKEREVTIESLTLVSWDDEDRDRPIAIVDVVCSAGTYVRALARDLGTAVGNAAYLGALRRTGAGRFTESDVVSLDDVRAAVADDPSGLVTLLRPIDDGLDRFPVVDLTTDEVDAVAHGQYVKPDAGVPSTADHYRLRGPDGQLVAIGVPVPGGRLAPDKVLITAPAAAAMPAEVGT